MLVTCDGMAGSIGGGTLEWLAMAEAQRLLAKGPSRKVTRHALGPDLGQCCGGNVDLLTEVFDASNFETWKEESLEKRRTLLLFGAGHVGRALVLVLAQTEFQVNWIDPRPNAFPTMTPANVKSIRAEAPETMISHSPSNSIVLVMSHSHALDLAIVDAALRAPLVAETGLIGSATKRARFEKRLLAMHHAQHVIDRLICPIGIGGIGSKRPEAIAISTAAQLLALDEKLKAEEESISRGKVQQVVSA